MRAVEDMVPSRQNDIFIRWLDLILWLRILYVINFVNWHNSFRVPYSVVIFHSPTLYPVSYIRYTFFQGSHTLVMRFRR
jgi:hypothetical protein